MEEGGSGIHTDPTPQLLVEGGELSRGLLLLLVDKPIPAALYLPPTERLFKARTITKTCEWEKGCIQT